MYSNKAEGYIMNKESKKYEELSAKVTYTSSNILGKFSQDCFSGRQIHPGDV